MAKRLEKLGYDVISTDIVNRGYGVGDVDFFKCTASLGDNIVTNPPYSFAKEWVFHSMKLLSEGKKLALFLPIQFLESEGRRKLLDTYNVKKIYTCTKRVLCGKNGDFRAKDKDGNVIYDKNGTAKLISSAKFYAWFVWQKGYKGDTTLIRI